MIVCSVKTNEKLKCKTLDELMKDKNAHLYILCKKGEAKVKSPCKFVLHRGIGIFFDSPTWQKRELEATDEVWVDYFAFKPENEEEKMLFGGIDQNRPLYHAFPEKLFSLIENMEIEYNSACIYHKEILSNLGMNFIYSILNYLHMAGNAPEPLGNHSDFFILRQRMYANPELDWTVERLSKELCFSRYYSQHMYKQYFGVSFIKDLTCARMTLACHLLKNTSMSVSQISARCGYKNLEHFVRRFSAHHNTSPTKYRKVLICRV